LDADLAEFLRDFDSRPQSECGREQLIGKIVTAGDPSRARVCHELALPLIDPSLPFRFGVFAKIRRLLGSFDGLHEIEPLSTLGVQAISSRFGFRFSRNMVLNFSGLAAVLVLKGLEASASRPQLSRLDDLIAGR
jgi:hypothetical protein